MAVHFHDRHPTLANLREAVVAGLTAEPKWLSAKFLYDTRGSALFDAICELPEYYVTRTEQALLTAHREEIAGLLGRGCLLIEPGSGASDKVQLLLPALRPAAYVPVEISRDHLLAAAERLAKVYPDLEIHATCADFTQPFELPDAPAGERKVIFFPGSTISNFEPAEAGHFLARMAALVGDGGGMLIGVDLKKDAAVLNAAYNDSQGVTAAFNLNLLTRIQRELGAELDRDGFFHAAFYNAPAGRVEMHLVASRAQVIRLGNELFPLDRGESIHTESSYKYTVAEFQALAEEAGFRPERVWIDADELFSLHYLSI